MFGGIGYQELLVVGLIAILLFGGRLPEVARSWGQSYRELRRSLNEVRNSFAMDAYEPRDRKKTSSEKIDDRSEESAPRFVPPPVGDERGPDQEKA
jgi:sec-independent protein translocase protein TatA